MRAWRNTVVRFGMAVVPVSLSPLVGKSPHEGHTHEIASGERVRRAWTTNGKDIVPDEETETRFERPDGDPVALDVRVQGETGIDIEAAVHIGDVDPALFDSSYAANPTKDGARIVATLAAVLRDTGTMLVGRARFTESASAKSVVLRWSPLTKGIVLETLSPLARVRIEDARKAAATDEPSPADYRQGISFVESLPDVLPDLLVQDERDEAIASALAALADGANEDETEDDFESAADLVSDFVSAGYRDAKSRRDAADGAGSEDEEDATVVAADR